MAKRRAATGRGARAAKKAAPGDADPGADGFIKVRVPCDPQYAATFGCTGERLWAMPTARAGVYRIDGIPMYTQAVRLADLVRVRARARPAGVHDLAAIVECSGHATFHVFVTHRDAKIDPEQDPAVAPVWKAWKKLERLGCSFEGDNSGVVYVLAVDAPPGVDLDKVRAVLDAGEARADWVWVGGGMREGDADPARRAHTRRG